MVSINDQHIREEALDPSRSFIVQAPAGSGKTALLTQRILVLLAQVRKPEQIVAITFTRKAAAEMRERVVAALQLGLQPPPEDNEYKMGIWRRAQSALKQNNKYDWHLIDNPNRLQIWTIDGFCARLTHAMPFLSQLGAPAVVLDDPLPCYQTAARTLLHQRDTTTSWYSSLEIICRHLDFNLMRIETLFVAMLQQRDQWLPLLMKTDSTEQLKATLENALVHVEEDAVKQCRDSAPEVFLDEINALLQYASTDLDIESLDRSEKFYWERVAALLLTKTGDWRKTVTKANGFPAPSSLKDKADKDFAQSMKERALSLFRELSQFDVWRCALQDIIDLPPTRYNPEQWEMIVALLDVLPLLAAQLMLAFSDADGVDFIEVAQRAQTALSHDDLPTDVALKLDTTIQHILIDEFQDTSISQWRLLTQLTATWLSDDGRTLFLVGDPMQSIYRFRQAEVGLFLRAKEKGLGHLPLISLQLTTNFRSQKGVLDWINQTCEQCFPSHADIAMGAVPYYPADPADRTVDKNVTLHQLTDEVPSHHIVNVINAELQDNPVQQIAILVRARHHAGAIIHALRDANIPYNAVDMESLTHRQLILDLWSLTRAISHLGDQVAWLSILRAPWCGLSLEDVHSLALVAADRPLWEALSIEKYSTHLSDDGVRRLKQFLPIMRAAINRYQQESLALLVQHTWLALQGPSFMSESSDQDHAIQFFDLLAQVEVAGSLVDLHAVQKRLDALFANHIEDNAQVSIMTIHKAKGLEFDTVILPSLERRGGRDDNQLLIWWERPRMTGEIDLLLSPTSGSDQPEQDSIYRYIRQAHQQQVEHELTRLFYVALTRAKRKLHLICNAAVDDEGEIKKTNGSFLNLLNI